MELQRQRRPGAPKAWRGSGPVTRIWLGLAGVVLGLGLIGVIASAVIGDQSRFDQYAGVIVLGLVAAVGIVARARNRTSVLTALELCVREPRRGKVVPVGQIGGVGLVSRVAGSPLGSWGIWHPVVWTIDGAVTGLPGIASLGRDPGRVLKAHAGRVARELFARVWELQGEGAHVVHPSNPRLPSHVPVVQILGLPDEDERAWFRAVGVGP